MTIILAYDPGKITGYAVASGGELKLHGQLPIFDFQRWAEEFIPTYAPWGLLVVGESFIIGQATMSRGADAHWAIEARGTVKYWCQKWGVDHASQQASAVKGFATDAKLKAIGWHKPSPGGHANDAARHLLVCMVNRKELDLSRLR